MSSGVVGLMRWGRGRCGVGGKGEGEWEKGVGSPFLFFCGRAGYAAFLAIWGAQLICFVSSIHSVGFWKLYPFVVSQFGQREEILVSHLWYLGAKTAKHY